MTTTNPAADSSSDQNPDTEIDDVTDISNKHQEIQQHQSLKTLTLDSSSASDFPDQINPQQYISIEDHDEKNDLDSIVRLEDSSPRLEESQIAIKRNAPLNRKKVNNKRRVLWEKKFEVLLERFNPIHFVPIESFDFSGHEALLKRLGLWDFVHMEFDRNVRKDLVAQLIATFSPRLRCSYVNGARIKVSRADLARALRLPVKNVRAENVVVVVGESNDLKLRRFMGDFLSRWVLLHNDTRMMPSETMNWTNVVREGKFEKVDWAGVIWFMVERELKEINGESGLGNCYYASHMQCLIKNQREQLLMEEAQIENDVKEEDDDVEIELGHDNAKIEVEDTGIDVDEELTETRDPLIEDSKVEASDNKLEAICREVVDDLKVEEDIDMEVEIGKLESIDVKMPKDVEIETVDMEMEPKLLEEHSIELSLGGNEKAVAEFLVEESLKDNAFADYDNVVVMEIEECKVEEEEGEEGERHGKHRQCLFVKGENSRDSFLQRCNLGNFGATELEQEMNVHEEDGKEDESDGLHGEYEDGGFHISPNGSSLQIYDNLSGDFFPSKGDKHINAGILSVFANGHKRSICHDNDLVHDSFNTGSKRIRTHSPWIDDSADASEVLDQAQYFLGKARNLVAEKEQALRDANTNQQNLLDVLHARDCMIEQLQKETVEVQNKKEMEVYRLGNELGTMWKLLQSYRNALKQTQRAFSEYRERCPPEPNELNYNDVPGSGGLVLSTMELEKISHLSVEKMMKEFEDECMIKFEEFRNRVDLLDDRLLDVEIGAKLITESFAKYKTAEVPDSPVPDVAVRG